MCRPPEHRVGEDDFEAVPIAPEGGVAGGGDGPALALGGGHDGKLEGEPAGGSALSGRAPAGCRRR